NGEGGEGTLASRLPCFDVLAICQCARGRHFGVACCDLRVHPKSAGSKQLSATHTGSFAVGCTGLAAVEEAVARGGAPWRHEPTRSESSRQAAIVRASALLFAAWPRQRCTTASTSSACRTVFAAWSKTAPYPSTTA